MKWVCHRNGCCAKHRQLLNGLVRRAVFANANAVVRHHIDHRQVHQRGESQRGLEVVRKYEERCAERMEPAVELDSVADARHCKLANAKVNIAAFSIQFREEAFFFHNSFIV